jgi:hypothetical protein
MNYQDLTIGETVAEVLCNWMSMGDKFDRRGWLRPFAWDVYQGLELFWRHGEDMELWVVVGPALARPATKSEERNLLEAIETGALEVYHRGTWDTYADRRWPKIVEHAATGCHLLNCKIPQGSGTYSSRPTLN